MVTWLLLGPGVLAMLGENDGPSMLSYAFSGATYGICLLYTSAESVGEHARPVVFAQHHQYTWAKQKPRDHSLAAVAPSVEDSCPIQGSITILMGEIPARDGTRAIALHHSSLGLESWPIVPEID